MAKAAIDLAETLARLSAATIFELRGEWRRLHRAPSPMRLSTVFQAFEFVRENLKTP